MSSEPLSLEMRNGMGRVNGTAKSGRIIPPNLEKLQIIARQMGEEITVSQSSREAEKLLKERIPVMGLNPDTDLGVLTEIDLLAQIARLVARVGDENSREEFGNYLVDAGYMTPPSDVPTAVRRRRILAFGALKADVDSRVEAARARHG